MAKKSKILVSWLGTQDIKCLSKDTQSADALGALASVLQAPKVGPFSHLCLVWSSDPGEQEANIYERKLALARMGNLCESRGIKVIEWEAPINSRASSPEKIHDFLLQRLKNSFPDTAGKEFYYNITSGTAVMAAIQLQLSERSAYAGTALYTVPKNWLDEGITENVFRVQLPTALERLSSGSGEGDEDIYTEPNGKIYEQVRLKVANTDAPVLILGDTGTGKTQLAKFISSNDKKRMHKPWQELNCATFLGEPSALKSELFGHVKGAYTGADAPRDGAFVKADGGTLFLDEVGEMPMDAQGMLLRALETGYIKPLGSDKEVRVDVRVVAATNVNLNEAIRAGRFREDLYYRLAKYTPRLKAVREYSPLHRRELLKRLLEKINRERHELEPRRLSPEAEKMLLDYPWPGNIREMQFRLESICLLAGELVEAADVAEQLTPPTTGGATTGLSLLEAPLDISREEDLPRSLDEWLGKWECHWLRSARHYASTQAEAASRLGLPTSTFSTKWRKYRLSEE